MLLFRKPFYTGENGSIHRHTRDLGTLLALVVVTVASFPSTPLKLQRVSVNAELGRQMATVQLTVLLDDNLLHGGPERENTLTQNFLKNCSPADNLLHCGPEHLSTVFLEHNCTVSTNARTLFHGCPGKSALSLESCWRGTTSTCTAPRVTSGTGA